MASTLSTFTTLKRLNEPREVRLCDETVVYVYGIGSVNLNASQSKQLRYALYVPDLGCNPISAGKTVKANCKVIFENQGYCEVIDKQTDKQLARGIYRQGLYEVKQATIAKLAFSASQISSSDPNAISCTAT